jgi:hypothetical protein
MDALSLRQEPQAAPSVPAAASCSRLMASTTGPTSSPGQAVRGALAAPAFAPGHPLLPVWPARGRRRHARALLAFPSTPRNQPRRTVSSCRSSARLAGPSAAPRSLPRILLPRRLCAFARRHPHPLLRATGDRVHDALGIRARSAAARVQDESRRPSGSCGCCASHHLPRATHRRRDGAGRRV